VRRVRGLAVALRTHGHHGRECGVHYRVLYNATGVRVREYPITLDKLIDRLPNVG
jgi:hypothetical protein